MNIIFKLIIWAISMFLLLKYTWMLAAAIAGVGRAIGWWFKTRETRIYTIIALLLLLLYGQTGGPFSVVIWGAVGDGVTDDTAAIQEAIDACDAAGGGVVYFPPGGTYLVKCVDDYIEFTDAAIKQEYKQEFDALKGLSQEQIEHFSGTITQTEKDSE